MKKMKKSIFLLFCTVFFSCNTAKKTNDLDTLNEITTICPDDGECTIVVNKNKKLNVLVDDFGSKYFQLLDNEGTSVIVFEYNKKNEENLQDGNYLEEVIFEIPNDVNAINLTDKELQSTKMLFGRHCFCKGQTGYFNVNNGQLKLIKKDNEFSIDLSFKINEVPQIISSIVTTIKY